MHTNRREFLDRLAVGTATLGGLSLGLGAMPAQLEAAGLEYAHQGTWNTRWPDRLTGRIRAVYDVPEVESGLGVWRASIWAAQYSQTLGIPLAECSTALVLRHNAIVLAMAPAYWEKYGVGEAMKVTHPLTGAISPRNPVLLGEADGLPQPFADFGLQGFHRRGGVTLACDLALNALVVPVVAQRDGVAAEVAKERAIGMLAEGVILQPSGVFAVMLAQQMKQAQYIRAS
jgi:hypothetical protein